MASSIAYLRLTNTLLAPLAPGLCARVAARLFTSPRRHVPPAREAAAEQSGARVTLASGVSALRWSTGARAVRAPRILAIHGWEGRATQWGPWAEPLTAAGFELIALDAPAHGRTPGHRAHPVIFADALHDADAHFGPFAAVLGHSMGAAAAALALSRGLRAEKAVLIASPSSIELVLRRFGAYIGLSATAQQKFFARMEDIVGLPADELDISELARSLRHPALLIHSRDDREVPATDSKAVARSWRGAKYLELDGLGHRRILRAPLTIEAAFEHISPPLARTA